MAKKEFVVELRIEDVGAVQRLGQLKALLAEQTAERNKLQAAVRKGIKLNEEETQRLGELGARTRNTSVQIRELENRLSGATAAGLRFRDKMADAAKAGLGAFGLNILTVSGAIAGLVSVVKGAVTTLADFDKALASVSALGGEYAANIDRISEATKTAGIQFGFTAVESVKAVEALAKAGVAVEDILGGGLEGALTLAAAGSLDVATAAEAAAKAMVQFGLAGEDVTHIADLFANSANKALGEVSDITAALNQSGQVANQFGVSIEETVGTLTAFANAGLLGSDAGTSFRTMLIRLAKPTDDAAKLMEQLGIQAFDTNGAFIGVEKLAGQLQTQLKDLTEEQRNSALATIFGTDAIRSASILYKGGAEEIKKWTKEVGESGEAARIAAEKTDNLPDAVGKFNASLDNLLLSGGALTTFFKDVVSGATDVINALAGISDEQPKIEAFTKSVQAQFEKLGGTIKLTAEEGSAAIQNFRFSAEAVITEQDIDQIVARGNLLRNKLKDIVDEGARLRAERDLSLNPKRNAEAIEANRIEQAAALAALDAVHKRLQALGEVQAKSKETTDVVVEGQVKQTGATEETTKSVKKLTAAQLERLAIEKEMAAIASQAPKVLQPIETPLPQATPLTGAPEAAQTFLDAQEALRIAQITGTEMLNLELLALDEQFYEEKIIGQEEYNARKKVLLDNDAEEQRQNNAMLLSSAAQFFGGLADLTEQGTAEYKELATVQALVNTYLGATLALTDKTIPNAFVRIAAAVAVIASGLASVRKIQGFAGGGKVEKNGRVTEAWGTPVNRSNGDTVLATLKPNEAVLNEDQQQRARIIYGDDFFRRIGVPGFAIGGRATRGSALVNFPSVPRPSPGEIANIEATAEARAFNFAPVVSVVEMNRVQDRVRVIQNLASA